ncbi:MAG: acetyltransferase [Bacteroidia bacterium]
MAKPGLFILGASGHAKVLADAVLAENVWDCIGFIEKRGATDASYRGISVIGYDDELPALMEKYGVSHAIIGVGENRLRKKIADALQAQCPELNWATVVHPMAWVSPSVRIGGGSVMMAGSIIQANSQIGKHCIVNTSASLDHDSSLGDFASLGPGTHTGGDVYIGGASSIGIGVSIKQGIRIGANSTIGAGSTVVSDIPDEVVAFGSPARIQ